MRDIETVLLIKNNCVACAVMQSQSYPRIVAFTADGDQVFVGCYYLPEIRLEFLSRNVDLFQTDLEKKVEKYISPDNKFSATFVYS